MVKVFKILWEDGKVSGEKKDFGHWKMMDGSRVILSYLIDKKKLIIEDPSNERYYEIGVIDDVDEILKGWEYETNKPLEEFLESRGLLAKRKLEFYELLKDRDLIEMAPKDVSYIYMLLSENALRLDLLEKLMTKEIYFNGTERDQIRELAKLSQFLLDNYKYTFDDKLVFTVIKGLVKSGFFSKEIKVYFFDEMQPIIFLSSGNVLVFAPRSEEDC